MKKHIRTLIKVVFGLAAITFALGGLFGFIDMGFILHGHDGVSTAFAAGAAVSVPGETVTTQVVSEGSPDLLRPTIDKNITLIQPDKFSFDTLLRNAAIHKQVNSYTTKYYSNESRGILDTVKTASSAVTSGTRWATRDIIVNAIHIWNKHDILLVVNKNGGDGKGLVYHVVDKDATTDKLKCIVLNPTTASTPNAPALSVSDEIARIGHAKHELDLTTDPYGVLPYPDYNYLQIHMAQVEESFLERSHAKEVKFDLADMYNQAAWDYRGQVEFSNLMGVREIGVDPYNNNKEKYFSGGILRSMTKSITVDHTKLTNAEFYSWAKDVFTGNNGSETRVLYASPDFMTFLGGIPTVQKQLEGRDTLVKWGIKFKEIDTNFGTFLVKHAPGFDYIGMARNAAVVDPAFLEKHVWKPLSTQKIDYKSSGLKNADASVMSEISCAVLKNIETHALLKLDS